jgi:hypothetical protein
LKSGLVAKLTIVPASALNGSRVYVPIGAIVEGNGRSARLFVLDKDRARSRAIEVAFIEGGIVALASGVGRRRAGHHRRRSVPGRRRARRERTAVSFLEFPIRRYQFTLVAFAMLVALGLTSFFNIPRRKTRTFR